MNSKLTRACLFTLCAYITLYTPTMVVSGIVFFIPEVVAPYLLDACLLLYFLNNVVNPFIYYTTLKDFREGYKSLLKCGRIKTPDKDKRPGVAVIQNDTSY